MTKKQKTEYCVQGWFEMPDRDKDKNAKTYWDSIRPTLITAEEYFAKIELREEWHKRHEEKALSDYYAVMITVEGVK